MHSRRYNKINSINAVLSVLSVALVVGVHYVSPELQNHTMAVCAGAIAAGSVHGVSTQEKSLTHQEAMEDEHALDKAQNLRMSILVGVMTMAVMMIGEGLTPRMFSVSALMGGFMVSHYMKYKVVKENALTF